MRNPNGYGAIVKLAGKRRKPFAVRITADYALNVEERRGVQKYKYIGYYEKRADAMRALAEYNAGPYDVDVRAMTVKDVYDRWSADHYLHIAPGTASNYKIAYKSLRPIENKPMRDLRLVHIQRVLDESNKRRSSQAMIRQLLHQLFSYAIKNDICEKNYASFLSLENATPSQKTERRVFTDAEIAALWASLNIHPYTDTILILIYTGLRVGELLELRRTDVAADLSCINVTRSKTTAGVRRVPIAQKIKPLIEARMKSNAETLITTPEGRPCDYQRYTHALWRTALNTIALGDHRPHDTRHTCISRLAAAEVAPEIIRAIVGHKGKSVTETVYTHFDLATLAAAIDKI